MIVIANAIVLVEQVGLLLPFISAVIACLLAVSGLLCIRAMPIVRCGVLLALFASTPISYN